jgi:hypothetical protein
MSGLERFLVVWDAVNVSWETAWIKPREAWWRSTRPKLCVIRGSIDTSVVHTKQDRVGAGSFSQLGKLQGTVGVDQLVEDVQVETDADGCSVEPL